VFIDPAAAPTYEGTVKWAPPNGPDSVLFAVILGPGRFNQGEGFNNPQIFDLVWTHKVNARLNYTLEALYGFQTNVPDVGFANWWAAVEALTCQFSPPLRGTVRLEFFDDIQGNRPGFAGPYPALTAGVTFKPVRSVALRPEVRFDYNTESRPFEGK